MVRSDYRGRVHEIAPDEIFLDSSNLPSRDDVQFEGRVVKPIGTRPIAGIGIAFVLVAIIFLGRSFDLGVVHGASYSEISRENHLHHSIVFAPRGAIYDRTGSELAWNELSSSTSSPPYALRRYTEAPGLSILLGFVRYPREDSSGNWWREETIGVAGAEFVFEEILAGANGAVMVETDALGNAEEQSIVRPIREGGDLHLTIDEEVQSKLFSLISAHAARQGFQGGAGVIMDVETGALLALTSFPEYDNAKFAEGDAEAVRMASSDARTPLLDRAISGLYAPGSILKPIFAAAALQEGIITPEKEIRSIGAITIPNPYDPEKPSIFRDWTVHGLVDIREAITFSFS